VELATSYLPWALAAGTAMTKENLGPGGIYARLEEAGHRLGRFTEEVAARMPTPDELRQLHLQDGVPVFALVRTAFDTAGNAVEVCDTIMAADRFILDYELPAR
jgi:GntR family transcriptional regulator